MVLGGEAEVLPASVQSRSHVPASPYGHEMIFHPRHQISVDVRTLPGIPPPLGPLLAEFERELGMFQ